MIWAVTLAICAICSLLNKFLIKNKKLLLPPSPRGWYPIIGHFHLLGKNPHRDLHNLSKIYGPIMYLQIGFVPNIIVSSPHGAEQFLKTHDLVFADRPPNQASKYISYEQRNLSFGKYGSYWRNMRKMCTLHLLSNLKINSFLPMRRQELNLFVKSLKQSENSETGVDLSAKVSSLTTNMSCLMVFGKKFEDWEFHERGFKDVMQESMHLSAKPNLGDYFPFLGVLDLQGLTKRMKEMSKIFDLFFEKIIDEHERSSETAGGGKDQSKDFVSTMLALMKSGDIDFEFDRRHIKAIMLDMLAASMDTSASVIEWLMSELLRQPRLMRKVQNELEQTIGLNRMVSESDLYKLNYLEMVIKETFRLHPPAPLLLPHSAMEDCRVDGYHIPKGSRVIINAWAIGRDPKVWNTTDHNHDHDLEKFVPERFDEGKSNNNVDVRGMNFELIPFGSGRRGCPGIQLGLTMVRLVAAQLLHCFDWKLPNNVLPEELDMEEEFGLVVSRAKHLMVIPTYRLRL